MLQKNYCGAIPRASFALPPLCSAHLLPVLVAVRPAAGLPSEPARFRSTLAVRYLSSPRPRWSTLAIGGCDIEPRSVEHATAVGDPIVRSLADVIRPWLPPRDRPAATHVAIPAVLTGDTVLTDENARLSAPSAQNTLPH
jgi:hypothetical protein